MKLSSSSVFLVYLLSFVFLIFSLNVIVVVADGPIEISTCQELQDIENDLAADYILVNDIDCYDDTREGGALYNDGAGFLPLGDQNPDAAHFSGTLDGQGYVITNLYIDDVDGDNAALIVVNDGTVQNIGMKDVDINGFSAVAPLVALNYGTVLNAYSTGEVHGNFSVGGLVGQNPSNFGTINRSYSTATVTGVEGDSGYVGGLVGSLTGGTIGDSYARGDVSGGYDVGGLVGRNLDTVERSYATGAVSGDENVGGLVGLDFIEFFGRLEGDTVDSFYDLETTGQADEDKGTGKSTAVMTSVATYTETDTVGLDAAWDFVDNPNDDVANNDYWDIDPDVNDGYPFLAWQDITAPTITVVTSDAADGSYAAGEVIDVDVTFSENVTSTGSVTVTLETGDTDRTCTFTVRTSSTGTCNYTVQEGDISSDLTVSSISGTIVDMADNVLTDFVPAANLAANKNIVIDTAPPQVPSGGGFLSLSYSNANKSKDEGKVETGAGIEVPFVDTAGHFAQEAIERLYRLGVVDGRTATAYEPDSSLTRAEVAKVALNVFHHELVDDLSVLDQFSDIDRSEWYVQVLATALQDGVMDGYGDGTMRPNAFVTRAEALKILLIAAGLNLEDFKDENLPFVDVKDDAWYRSFVAFAYSNDIVNGKTIDSFDPDAFITRGEMAVIAVRILDMWK